MIASSRSMAPLHHEQSLWPSNELPKRRVAARELARELGVEIKFVRMSLGTYDRIIDAEAVPEETIARFVLSLTAGDNLRTTTTKVFNEAEKDKIIAGET